MIQPTDTILPASTSDWSRRFAAVRGLTTEQRRELMEVLATVETRQTPVSASRRALVEAIKGKYRKVPTSSESFMSRKREDIALESRS